AEGHRTGVSHGAVVPVRTIDDIVAVVQRRHARVAESIAGRGADEAVGGGDHTGDPGGPTAKGHRTGVSHGAVVPGGAADYVVAVPQRRHAIITDIVAGVRTAQCTDQAARRAVEQVD